MSGSPTFETAAKGIVSPTMQQALDFALKYGGKLKRFPGGFWTRGPEHPQYLLSQSFGTKTVEALVKRGLGEYTEWKDGRNGRFPVEFTVLQCKGQE